MPPSPTRKMDANGDEQQPVVQTQVEAVGDDDTSGANVELADPAQELTSNIATHTKTDTVPTFHPADINDHYWESQSTHDANVVQPKPGFRTHHGTINASAAHPNELRYVMLFHDANPRWESDGIIFVKSSIRIPPDGERFKDDPKPSSTGTVF